MSKEMINNTLWYLFGVLIGILIASNGLFNIKIKVEDKPTTTPTTAVDIVNYTCTTFDDLTMKCEVNGRG